MRLDDSPPPPYLSEEGGGDIHEAMHVVTLSKQNFEI